MTDLTVKFALPWLLLLIIPCLLLALIPHFKIAKKYRRTRNRIISLVLHVIVIVMCISLLSGITFAYDVPNKENEIIFLIDESYSIRNKSEEKETFVEDVINASDSNFSVGIVAFGYGQVTVAELSHDMDYVLRSYRQFVDEGRAEQIELIDETATDFASAINYAKDMFTFPETGKIILVTDGLQTDGDALTSVKMAAADGIKVDVVHFPEDDDTSEVSILNTVWPDGITQNSEADLNLTLYSTVSGMAEITLYDRSESGEELASESKTVTLVEGEQSVPFPYTFTSAGLHEIRFEIGMDGDTLEQNNEYYSYIYLYVFKDVLMLESIEGEGDALKAALEREGYDFNVTLVNINTEPEKVPQTLEALCYYDQVILANISDDDLTNTQGMPEGFDHILNRYASEIGGGVLAIGGSTLETADSDAPVSHAFNREDMRKSTYFADMLPVEAVEYTPPLGVMIILDCSGSMTWDAPHSSLSRMTFAKRGVQACLDALTYRDWVGVMTFQDTYNMEVELLPISERNKIEATLSGIDAQLNTPTVYGPALQRAGQALKALDTVERRHIILVSDGAPNLGIDEGDMPYGKIIEDNFDAGITMSIINIGGDGLEEMEDAASRGGGQCIPILDDANDIISEMRNQLEQKSLTDIDYSPYRPVVSLYGSDCMKGVNEAAVPELGVYFGTREKEGSTTPLRGGIAGFAPLYSQWKYGKGYVGAFLSSLRGGSWSGAFLNSPDGSRILYNIVSGLMPSYDIEPNDIRPELHEENYRTRISINTSVDVNNGESIEVVITDLNDNQIGDTIVPNAAEGYTRATFELKDSGLYKVVIKKTYADGSTKTCTTYKAFSYSAEYNAFMSEEESLAFLTSISESGNGSILTDPISAFADFETVIHKTYDPRILFMILSIVLFLLDIAVRKFKFKWPHELIRDHKAKKNITG